MKRMIYLAQPIDQAKRTPRITRLRAAAELICSEARLALFQPAKAYRAMGVGRKLQPEEHDTIDQINQAALAACGGLLAVLPLGVPTLGTPVEIERTLNAGKPVIILTEEELARSSVQVVSWWQAGAQIITLEQFEQDQEQVAQRVLDFLARRDWPEQNAQQQMLYTLTDPAANVPRRAHDDDAGFDLSVCETVEIPAGESMLIRTGFAAALPEGHWGLIVGRSSTWTKRRLDVKLGVIDVGWRGDLYIQVVNCNDEPVKVEAGERLAQYIVLPAWAGRLVPAPGGQLPPHARGTNGFGSSGR